MRDRLVSGIQNDRIHEKLLSKKDVSYTSTEAIQLQAQDMATLESSAVPEVTTHAFKEHREDCQLETLANSRSHAGIVVESTI